MRDENSGGDVSYYVLDVPNPKRFKPCTVECEDVIAALGLNFFEGEAFKAIWRKGAQRTFGVGKAGNTALRDAEKMAHYGARELAHEQHRAATRPEPAANYEGEQLPDEPSWPKPKGTFGPGDNGVMFCASPSVQTGDGWVPHNGALMAPKMPGVLVEVRHRDGTISGPELYEPGGAYWSWMPGSSAHNDIVAARWSYPA